VPYATAGRCGSSRHVERSWNSEGLGAAGHTQGPERGTKVLTRSSGTVAASPTQSHLAVTHWPGPAAGPGGSRAHRRRTRPAVGEGLISPPAGPGSPAPGASAGHSARRSRTARPRPSRPPAPPGRRRRRSPHGEGQLGDGTHPHVALVVHRSTVPQGSLCRRPAAVTRASSVAWGRRRGGPRAPTRLCRRPSRPRVAQYSMAWAHNDVGRRRAFARSATGACAVVRSSLE
jgi:hypothetical protein